MSLIVNISTVVASHASKSIQGAAASIIGRDVQERGIISHLACVLGAAYVHLSVTRPGKANTPKLVCKLIDYSNAVWEALPEAARKADGDKAAPGMAPKTLYQYLSTLNQFITPKGKKYSEELELAARRGDTVAVTQWFEKHGIMTFASLRAFGKKPKGKDQKQATPLDKAARAVEVYAASGRRKISNAAALFAMAKKLKALDELKALLIK